MNETYIAYGVLLAALLFLAPLFFAAMIGFQPTGETTSDKLKQIYSVGLGVFLGLSPIALVVAAVTWAIMTVMK